MTVSTDNGKKGDVKAPPVKNFWRILSFGTRLEHGVLIVALVSATASGVALPLMNIVFGNLVGNFNDYFVPGSGVTESQFKASVAKNALFFVYLFIGKFVLSYVGMFCFRTAGLRLSAALRLSYLKALFLQPIKKLDEVSTGAVSNTITTSANTIQLSVSDRLSAFFQSLALVIAAFSIAFRYSWALTLATSSGILFLLGFYGLTTPPALKSIRRVDEADEKHATVAAETISSIRTVFALGAEEKMIERYTKWVDKSHKYGMKMGAWVGLQLPPMYFAIYCCYALAFWFGLKLYREGHIKNVGIVVIVFFSVLIVNAALGQILHPLLYVQKAISASVSFFDMMDSESVHTAGLKEPEVSALHDIELKDVTFAYPTRPGVEVLKDLTITFQKGKTTALVGPSGSGKSTIVALLERWYDLEGTKQSHDEVASNVMNEKTQTENGDAQIQELNSRSSGSISIGGHTINEFDLRWWRTQVGLVQQEPFLFNDTIENNVAYGLIGTAFEVADAAKKLELVKEACEEAFANEFIHKLPKGYSSIVGEGGIKLSGGQRQRIAIARSIVRQPAVLILDEATSAIDVRGEKIVQAALDRASKNRTTIVIAHRLSTIRKADHIVVLRSGHKIEEGTHEQLMSIDDGLYHGLVRAQMIAEQHVGDPEYPSHTAEEESAIEPVISRISRKETRASSLAKSDIGSSDMADIEKALPPATYKRKGLFGTVGVLLYEQRSKWLLYGVIAVSAMGAGAAYALQSWFFAQLVQTFQYTGQRLIDAANFWSLMFFALAWGVAICYATLGMSSVFVSTDVGAYCRKHYFRSTLKMPIVYFDREENASGSVVQRLSGDPKQVLELLGLNSSLPLISVFNVVGCVIISFYFGWKLTLVTFFAVMPVIIGSSFIRVRYEVQFEKLNAGVFATSSQFATEAVAAFRTVASLTMEEVIIEKYRKLLHDQVTAATRKASYAMLMYALTDSIELCGMALTFWYGGQLLASREYGTLQFYIIYAATIQGAQAAGQYLSITPNLVYATASANRILEMRSRVPEKTRGESHGKFAGTGKGAEIEFKDISFQYPGVDVPLFTRLNLSIQAGQFVAFVGPSGCGKTTMISLLERFYHPFFGSITLDGDDITAVDPVTYRQSIALVSQEPRLFSGTIRENLVIGVDDATVTDEQIEQACRDAEIHEFIISLPEGYRTELGQNTSTALSGGQKQRLCLARALLRRPKLLLLDEATSSLDSQSEKLVQGAIERLAGQRNMTVVAVAHRLATIQKADVIFVFGERDTEGKRGSKLVERGSHNELLAKRGVYYSMCQAQALDK